MMAAEEALIMWFHTRHFARILLLTVSVTLFNNAWATPQADQSSTVAKSQHSQKKKKQATASDETSKSAKVDLNSASKEELDAIPGIAMRMRRRSSMLVHINRRTTLSVKA
jgi:DNA uptake protein ComE-like DNA-binding protein